MKYKYYIGIDTGVNTGFCIYNSELKQIHTLRTLLIHQAMSLVLDFKNHNIFVRVEDARLRKWFGNSGREKLQGAGSVKRDAKIWEDFLTDIKVPCEMVAPKSNKTKIDAKMFSKITGWNGKCSEHARDSAMLVYGL